MKNNKKFKINILSFIDISSLYPPPLGVRVYKFFSTIGIRKADFLYYTGLKKFNTEYERAV